MSICSASKVCVVIQVLCVCVCVCVGGGGGYINVTPLNFGFNKGFFSFFLDTVLITCYFCFEYECQILYQ